MVLQVFPDDLNGVEFRAVRRQVHQYQAVLYQPFVPFVGVNVVMDAGIVQDDHRQGHPRLTPGNAVNQGDHGIALDRVAVQVVPDRAGSVVQGADHVHPRPGCTGVGGMGLAFRRPCPLHVGYRAETALVQIEQAQLACPGGILTALEVDLCGLEPVGAAFFSTRAASV